MTMLFANPYFWLGQLGLVMAFISCTILGHRFRDRPFLTEILPFWFAAIMSLFMLVRPAVINFDHTIPAAPYLYRLAIGLLLTSRAWVWRKASRPDQVKVMDQLLSYLIVVCVVFLMFLGFKLKNK